MSLSTSNSPLYIDKSNLTSNFNKGVVKAKGSDGFWVGFEEEFELWLEGEDGDEGDSGGPSPSPPRGLSSPPIPFPFSSFPD